MPRRFLPTTLLLGLLVLGSAAPAAAQVVSFPRFGVGYVADPPDLLGGASAYAVFPVFGGLGLYADVKWDTNSPAKDPTFDPNITAMEAENQIQNLQPGTEDNSWRSYNVALVRPLSSSVMIYAGAGYAVRTHYREYKDPSEQRGQFGYFWAEDPSLEKTTVNLMLGGISRVSRFISLQFGFETAPRGLTVGASFRLPPR